MNNTIKTYAVPLVTIAGLLLAIMWMAGTFDTKIEPGQISSNTSFTGQTFILKSAQIQLHEDVPATVRSKQTTHVAARVLAPIKAIHVKAGDTVKKGDLLIELDNRNNRSSVAQSRENINSLQAQLIQARSHYKRTKNLFSKESVTKAQLEQASASYNSLKAQLGSAKQMLSSAKTTLSYSQIKAQFSARVIDRFAEPGDLASPGMKLLTLYDPASLRIDANVRESLALTLKIGQQLKTDIPALNKSTQATIEEIVPAANPGARSFLIKAKIDHNGELLPGMFARIHIPSGNKEQLQIPTSYIKQMGQLDVVWVLENNAPTRRFIRVGQKTGNKIIVISGLSIGEKLVSPKQLRKK
ncbi:MAG: efflux RND transporter periplasmic adaptor subunit [Methylococcales bacterium]|nr:efflux RND transporter periplasmic adaptor subunit [Methylococcales bacterium]